MPPVMPPLDRRTLLRLGLLGGAAATAGVAAAELVPQRDATSAAAATRLPLPPIQHDVRDRLAPARTIDGTAFQPAPAYTLFLTFSLQRPPTHDDQRRLADALEAVEAHYAFSPSGVMTTIAYGAPYLARLRRSVVTSVMPTLLADPARPAFEEAQPSPTDLVPGGDATSKRRFRTPVTIERHDVLMTLRGDTLAHLLDAAAWLDGGDRLAGETVASPSWKGLWRASGRRLMFVVPGLPRRLAEDAHLQFASRVPAASAMWMGFSDQQAAGIGPADITTFAGSRSARLTSARPGDYLDLASVQHLSHTVLDLDAFYLGIGAPDDADRTLYTNRLQYMFRPNPAPADPFDTGNGYDGPVNVRNDFHGPGDAEEGAQGRRTNQGIRRVGHLNAMQRRSRAADGTPLHIRVDGPGFDDLDVPDGSRQPKLHFSIFMASAEAFATMRRDGAAVDITRRRNVADLDNGIERFLTTTRRQNFLVPPRRYRAFPMLELT